MALFDPVGYQIWLAALQKLTGGLPSLVIFFTVLLSLATPWLWFRALRELLRSKSLALAGWVTFTWLPSWLAIYGYFMTETLLLPLLGLALWLTLRARRKRRLGALAVAASAWAAAALTRGIAAPLGLVACAWLLRSARDKPRAIAILLLIGAVLFAPLSVRNHQLTGLWSPLGNAYLNRIYAESGARTIALALTRDGAAWAYGFGSPSMGTEPLRPFSDWTGQRTGTVTVTVDLGRGGEDWRAALERAALAGERGWLYAENLVFLAFGASWPDNDPAQWAGRLQIHSRWIWFPLAVLVVVATIARWRELPRYPLVPALLLVWFLFQGVALLSVNEGRYRKPAEGLLVVQLFWLLDRRTACRRTRPTGSTTSVRG